MRGTLLLSLLFGAAAAAAEVPFPDPGTKKGLQVQMVDDALALGVRHATLNVLLPSLVAPDDLADGRVRLAGPALAALDARVAPLSRAGVVVYLILLGRPTGDPRVDARLLDARGLAGDPPNGYVAFRADGDGPALLAAVCRALAERYAPRADAAAAPAAPRGVVRGWIVGNEVNSHWWWYHLGRAPLDDVADAVERAARAVWEGVTAVDPAARVYLSFEHHWGRRYAAGAADQAAPGRALLRAIAARARGRGDFPWHVAFHPYPEDLFDCRFWEDESATPADDSPRVTFRNLEVLDRALREDALTFEGAPRRVILSEQGFHADASPAGARLQAAAYARAWRRVAALEGIDAFILHRHVDHAQEGGLRLGVWTRAEGTVCTPHERRPLWALMRDVDGPDGPAAIERALSAAGLE